MKNIRMVRYAGCQVPLFADLTAIDLAYSLLHDWREAKRWMADARPCFGFEQSLRDTEWVTRMLSLRRRRQFH